MAARSFCTSVTSPDGLSRVLREARGAVTSPTGGLVFVTGPLVPHLRTLAGRVAAAWKGVPTVLVPSAGVLHERAELEGVPAVSGLLWNGGQTTPFALDGADDAPRALGESIGHALGARPSSALLFHRAEGFDTSLLEGLAAAAPSACVFGAGTVGAGGMVVTADGEERAARAVGMAIKGLASPIVATSPACRLVSDLAPIDEVHAGLVTRVGGRSALDELSRCAPGADNPGAPSPLVFAALAEPDDVTEDGRPRFVIRPVRGIDPSRRGVMIGADARPGLRMAFAVRDAQTARTELEAMARVVSKNALGAAPRFALYVTCAGRGQSLYGVPDAEVRILRQRFGDLPIAGMHAAFEISPREGRPSRLDLYTSVLALFRSPS
ncbi:FIST signal transduction protein [Polyangium sorediatum]|uniref:FIST C-terminal domain-containing protein n=1 Tax=Polyangium sorediatum TaxID=889274 RepID=A0ABT6NM44_9BACT|nr:FIST C-terminal domain-containing protein [Polyangium sorediatum]MDI1429317.1 FIST C-terminal domain-containing protein [Polyangium sorediatum]